jgi:GT2 family glycosyltransferase
MQAEHSNFRVVTWKEGFNYSAINNYGVSFAKGEYLLLLNNDTELIDGDSIKEMLGFCQREDVGIAGARLLYGDDTIQHAGVVIGFGGIAGHTFIGLHKAENSYFHRAMCAQDYSAVTAACLMTKKSVFDQVGGLSPELAVAFNDIDYCMKVRALGKLVVYAPYSCFYHYESKSRGLEDTPEKIARFNREVAIFIRKWPDIIQNGDPCYNPNLTLRKSNFALRDLLKEKIGEPYDLKIYQQFAPEDDTKAHE